MINVEVLRGEWPFTARYDPAAPARRILGPSRRDKSENEHSRKRRKVENREPPNPYLNESSTASRRQEIVPKIQSMLVRP